MRLLFIFCLISQFSFAGVLTPHGYVKEEKLNIGDSVIGKNGINIIQAKRNFDTACTWYLINGKYKFYCNQSLFVKGAYGVCHTSELKIGWKIYNSEGKQITITSIKPIRGPTWWKLDISGDHSYIIDDILVHNAARFWNKQNASANWNATAPTNWGSSSGTADGASVPGASDDVTLDGAGAGGNASGTVSANITILSLSFTTGYTATVTLTNAIILKGNFTDQTTHSWAGTNIIQIDATSTVTSNGKTFPNNVTLSTTHTTTLSGDWTISGTLTVTNTQTINSGTLTVGGLTMSGPASGTTTISMSGGTWSGGSVLSNSLTIAGNVTISAGGVSYGTGTLTYTSGTVTTTGSTLQLAASCTLNTNGINWNNITFITATQTATINSLLTVNGILTINDGIDVTFAGTAGFTAATFTISSISARNIQFKDGVTYTITASFNAFASRAGSILVIKSSHATNTTAITLNSGASCSIVADFTRVDASGGRTINTFHGTLTSTTNIVSYTDFQGGSSGAYLFSFNGIKKSKNCL